MTKKILSYLEDLSWLLKIVPLIILISLFLTYIRNDTHVVKAQNVYDLTCPSGTAPFWIGQTSNPQTNNLKANACIDNTGTIFWNGGVTNTNGPSGSTGLGNAQAGQVLAGPVPTGGPNNPSFELSVNSIQSQATSGTITSAPLVSNSVAIFTRNDSTGQTITTPSGYTVITNTVTNGVFYKNLNSTSNITLNYTVAGTANLFNNLTFLGGTITSVPHSATINTACGNGCVTGTINSITSGNVLLLVANQVGAQDLGLFANVIDNNNNTWQKIGDSWNNGGGASFGLVMFIAQFVGSGNTTITLNAHNILQNWSTVNVYELAGPTSYYTGLTGPISARFLTPGDLAPALGNVPTRINNGTVTMPSGSAIAAGSCTATTTVAAAGVATTDIIAFVPNASPTGNPQAFLIIQSWPTSGNVNFSYCNPGTGSLTPTANTLNWAVYR